MVLLTLSCSVTLYYVSKETCFSKGVIFSERNIFYVALDRHYLGYPGYSNLSTILLPTIVSCYKELTADFTDKPILQNYKD